MTPENPKHYYPEGKACWLSVDILIEHFPHLMEEIRCLTDSEIAYIDKKACEIITCSYWVAMEIVINEYLEKKKAEKTNDESLESGFE